jgi:hypothetical protein
LSARSARKDGTVIQQGLPYGRGFYDSERITMLAKRLMGALAAMLTTGMVAFGTLPAQAAAQRVELQAVLHGSHAFPHATGSARFESGNHGRELTVTVSHIARLAGRHLTVFVHGARAGTMTVSRTGVAHLHHHGVPACRAGQRVRVRTGTGTLVASGIFRRHH